MPSPQRPTRLFLVGCARSGTTLLQALVTRHAAVTTFAETHFFAIAFNARAPLRGWAARRALRRAAGTAHLTVNQPGPAALILGRSEPYIRAFISALDARAQADGNMAWLEKTPRHVFFVRQISETVQEAQFIHLIRDGRSTVASLYDLAHKYPGGKWERYSSLDYCIQRWNRSVRESLRWQGRAGHHFVRYEDITRNSSVAIEALVERLGIEYYPIARSGAPSLPEFTEPHEAWKSNASLEVYDPGLAKYHSLFDAAQRNRIEAGLMDVSREPAVRVHLEPLDRRRVRS